MKKIKFLWTLMALPLLAACSHDDLVNTGSENGHIPEGEGVYITVNFAPFNKGTRSYTNGNNSSNGGTEVGSSSEDGTINENKITSVLLVLATTSNSYIGSSLVDNTDQTGNSTLTANSETLYQAKAVFQKAKIQQFYNLQEVRDYIDTATENSSDPNPPVNIFLYCNPTQTVIEYFAGLNGNPTDWVNKTFTLTDTKDDANKPVQDNSLWTQGKFLMTNESLATRYFPYDPNTWNQFNTANNAFDLSGMNNRGQSNEVNNYKDGGSINVQRVAARFDFRDGSQIEGPNNNGLTGSPYTYKIIVDADQKPLVLAEIINMSLVNMLKEGFYLGRVATGTEPDQWNTPWAATESGNNGGYQLLGLEKQWFASTSPNFSEPTGGNYVVTPNPDERLGTALKTNKNFATYYKYPFFNPQGYVATRGFGWYTTPMSDFSDKNKYPEDNAGGNYQRWRYVTENTMAGGAADQINGASTGIVFKAKLKSGSALTENSVVGSENYNYWDAQLKNTLDDNNHNGPIIFAFSNNLYVSWKHVQYAALRSAGYVVDATTQNLDRTGTFYKAVFGNGGVGTIVTKSDNGNDIIFTDDLAEDQNSANFLHSQVDHEDENPNNPDTSNDNWIAFRNKVVANSFTIYEKFGEDTTNNGEKDTWGYYCYYFYWNRHNDNGINGNMAPMEFAVVRNNVYKLAVTSLKKLGHPRIPENDPDDPKPDTPDEKADVYMTVSVQVLPWVVRVNNIEF